MAMVIVELNEREFRQLSRKAKRMNKTVDEFIKFIIEREIGYTNN